MEPPKRHTKENKYDSDGDHGQRKDKDDSRKDKDSSRRDGRHRGDVRRESEHKHQRRREDRSARLDRNMAYYRRKQNQKANEDARRRAQQHVYMNTQSERPASARVVRRLAPRPRSISLSRGRGDVDDHAFPLDGKTSAHGTFVDPLSCERRASELFWESRAQITRYAGH